MVWENSSHDKGKVKNLPFIFYTLEFVISKKEPFNLSRFGLMLKGL